MVVIGKAYSKTRTMLKALGGFVLLTAGFAILFFGAQSKTTKFAQMSEIIGIAHADVPPRDGDGDGDGGGDGGGGDGDGGDCGAGGDSGSGGGSAGSDSGGSDSGSSGGADSGSCGDGY